MLTKDDVVRDVSGDWLYYAQPGDIIWLEKEQQPAKIDRGLHAVDAQGLGWVSIRRWLGANNKHRKPWTENWMVRKNGSGVDGRMLLFPMLRCPNEEDGKQVLLAASSVASISRQMEQQNVRITRIIERLNGLEGRLSRAEEMASTSRQQYSSARETVRADAGRLLMAVQKLMGDVEELIKRTTRIKGPLTDGDDRDIRDIQLPGGQ